MKMALWIQPMLEGCWDKQKSKLRSKPPFSSSPQISHAGSPHILKDEEHSKSCHRIMEMCPHIMEMCQYIMEMCHHITEMCPHIMEMCPRIMEITNAHSRAHLIVLEVEEVVDVDEYVVVVVESMAVAW